MIQRSSLQMKLLVSKASFILDSVELKLMAHVKSKALV